MAMSYEQLMKWRPKQIAAAGDEVNTLRKRLIDQHDEMSVGKVPESWTGASADRARQRYDRLHDSLNDLAAPVSKVRDAIDEAAAEIKSAKRAAESAYEAIRGKDYEVVQATSEVVLTSPPPARNRKTMTEEEAEEADAKAEADAAQVAEFREDLIDALRKAAQADVTLNAVLLSAATNQIDGGEGSIRQASLPPELRGLSASELTRKLIDDPGRYDGYVDALTPAQQAALGEAIGARGNDLRNDSNVETEEVKEFGALLKAYGEDAEVATGFLNEVGPEGLLELNTRAALYGEGDDDKAYATAMRDLQRSLGATLAAGTQDIGSYDAGTPSRVSNEWKWDLIEAGQKEISLDGGGTIRGFQALAPLLSNGEPYDPEFLSFVGEEMLDYERNWDWDEDRGGPWRSGGANSTARLDFTDGWSEKDTLGRDPITGLMRGLEDNPEASRQFFGNSTTSEDGSSYSANLEYLLFEREDEGRWIPDDGGATPGEKSRLTGLDSLGGALEAATVGDGADERSVSIVESLVDRSYEHYGDSGKKFSGGDFVPPELRDDFANITSRYMGSVHHELSPSVPDGRSDLTEGYVFDDARFQFGNADEASRASKFWLAEIAKDPEAAEQLRVASNAWTADKLTQDLHGIESPSHMHDKIHPTVVGNNSALGAIDFGAAIDEHDDQALADKRANERIDKGVGIVGKVLGETPVGKVPGSGIIFDQILGETKQLMHQDHAGETNASVGKLFGSTEAAVQQVVRDTYWHSLPPDAYPRGMGPDTNLNELIDSEQVDYQRWLDDNPWGAKLKTELAEIEDGHSDGLERAKQELEQF